MIEKAEEADQNPELVVVEDDQTPNPVVGDYPYTKEFFRCLILLNAQETRVNQLRLSVAKDYFQYAAEICYLGKSRICLSKSINCFFNKMEIIIVKLKLRSRPKFDNNGKLMISMVGLLYHVGYDATEELIYLDGQYLSEAPKLYEKKDLLGCYETVYCTLNPDSDPWCTEADTRIIDNNSLQISKF